MKIFLDTANIDEIREAASLGVLDGVTTNPSLVSKEGRGFRETIEDIARIVSGPISAEVTALEADEMVRQGREYASWATNVVVKCPLTAEGLKATSRLSRDGIKVNVTLVFSAPQGLLAVKAGASFISPFVGRIDDTGHDGMELVRDLRLILDNYDYSAEIIAASIRHPIHVVQAAKIGAHIATMPYKVFESLLKHPLTDRGLEQFLADWKKVPQEARV
jgi:transaldolase